MGMEKILLLDSNSLINRAFYALPNLRNHKGQYTGAIFGYMNMLLKLIDTYKPTYVIATFDKKSRLFRKDIYEDYKGNRKPMPLELASQMQPMKDILSKMEIPIVELDCYEADDIIGTIAKKYPMQTYIVTGDKDSLQLIDNTTTVLLTKKGVTEIDEYTPEKSGASPDIRRIWRRRFLHIWNPCRKPFQRYPGLLLPKCSFCPEVLCDTSPYYWFYRIGPGRPESA